MEMSDKLCQAESAVYLNTLQMCEFSRLVLAEPRSYKYKKKKKHARVYIKTKIPCDKNMAFSKDNRISISIIEKQEINYLLTYRMM